MCVCVCLRVCVQQTNQHNKMRCIASSKESAGLNRGREETCQLAAISAFCQALQLMHVPGVLVWHADPYIWGMLGALRWHIREISCVPSIGQPLYMFRSSGTKTSLLHTLPVLSPTVSVPYNVVAPPDPAVPTVKAVLGSCIKSAGTDHASRG